MRSVGTTASLCGVAGLMEESGPKDVFIGRIGFPFWDGADSVDLPLLSKRNLRMLELV